MTNKSLEHTASPVHHFSELVARYAGANKKGNFFVYWSEIMSKGDRIELCKYLGINFSYYELTENIKSYYFKNLAR